MFRKQEKHRMLPQTASSRCDGREKATALLKLYTENIIIQFLNSCLTESTVKPQKLFLFSYIMPKNPNRALCGKSRRGPRAAIPEKIGF
jgi:hypothetical protein